jgi:hypothetical protein
LSVRAVEGSKVLGCDVVEFLEEIARVGDILVLGISLLYDVSVLGGHGGIDLNMSLGEVLDSNSV